MCGWVSKRWRGKRATTRLHHDASDPHWHPRPVARKPSLTPRVIVFAGPNGAGKSTHADAILEALRIRIFVNADVIARGLSGVHTDVVRRRFARSHANFFALYAPLADDWVLFDNSHAGDAHLIAEFRNQHLQIEDVPSWNQLKPKDQAPT